MRKKHFDEVVRNLTEWKEKVFGNDLELKVTCSSFLGSVDHISIDSGLPGHRIGSGYPPPKSSEELLKILKKEIVEFGWSYAGYPEINLAHLDGDDVEIFRNYLKNIEEELSDTQTQIDDLLEEREDLRYGVETVKRRIVYSIAERK